MTRAIMTRRAIIGLGIAAVTSAGWYWFRPRPQFAGENIDAPTAHARALAGSLTLIDIRRPDEWQATGVGQGARPLDMRRGDFTDALLALTDADATTPIALICARGVRSARLASRLAGSGFTRIINVPEGMLGAAEGPGWIARGLPLESV
jgi:rhodanese-related sulfurtransferase